MAQRTQGLPRSARARRSRRLPATTPDARPSAGRSAFPARRWLLAIVALGLALRLGHFAAIAGTPWLQLPVVFDQSDMHTFWKWAEAIRGGDWLSRDTYHPYFQWMKEMAPPDVWHRWWGGKAVLQEAPLYPYWIAALLAIWPSLWLVALVQLVIGALGPVVMFSLARRMFDDRVGLVAAGITAVYGPFVFHQAALLRDWLPPLLEPLAILCLVRARATERLRDWALAGAVLGLAVLTRETVLIFVAVAIAWVVAVNRAAARQAALSATALVAGLLLVVSPLVARNVIAGAPAFAISNRAAEGIIEGNAADGFPIGLTHPPSMKSILERSGGRVPAVVRETLRTYGGDWGRFAGLQWTKLRALADPLEVPNNLDFGYALEISPALWPTMRYGLLLPLGATGFLLALGRWREHLLLVLYGASTVGALMSTIVLARFRLTLVPVLTVYAGFGGIWLLDALRARQGARAVAYAGLLAGLAALDQLAVPIAALRDNAPIAVHGPEYFLGAGVYAKDGRFDRAAAEMERLEARARERPPFAPLMRAASFNQANYRIQWANQLLERGLEREARLQLERAEDAYRTLPKVSVTFYALALSYRRLGDGQKARALFESFLALEPYGPRADAARGMLAQLAP